MKSFLALFACFGIAMVGTTAPTPSPPRFNVLFIMSDDMRPELGCYGAPVKSPNLDKLAATGLRFDRAYVQYPLCNPSRTSLLTGRHPVTTGVLDNRAHFRDAHPDWITLPQLFKQHGYVSIHTGKIFHGGLEDPASWSPTNDVLDTESSPSSGQANPGRPAPRQREPGEYRRISDRINILADDEHGSEDRVANEAIALLEKHKATPFFLAVGFHKPHSPPTAPRHFFDLYNANTISLPPDFAAAPKAPEGFPHQSITANSDLFIQREATPEQAREVIRAYRASVSWVDACAGRVLDALDRLGLRDNTIVLFWGDHGYHLGEKGKWAKHGSLYEVGTRCPLLIRVPGMTAAGQSSSNVVQALDLYPTLAELCSLPRPKDLQGHSLVPTLSNPSIAWTHPAYSVAGNLRNLHRAVRTSRWRFAEYANGQAMLIDMVADPHERTNLASDPAHATVLGELRETLATAPFAR